MNLRLKSRKLIKLIAILSMGFLLVVLIFWGLVRKNWTIWDFSVLDLFYKRAVKSGYGPQKSPHIVYVTITDESYDFFGKNILDRSDAARVNNALAELGPEAVAYDIIFARPSNSNADQQFLDSLGKLGVVYLPIGFDVSEKPRHFTWKRGRAYERLRSDYLQKPIEKGHPNPFYATRALMQMDDFAEAAFNSGHISGYSDPDGVYRHMVMLLKVDDAYFPTLTLSMFLDYARVPFHEMIVEWGYRIVIPASKDSFLEEDVIIPIDSRGRTVIPFAQVWDKGYKKMVAHKLLQYIKDENLRGNLSEFFEGNFVLIGDTSIGVADLGHTPLQSDVPLIILHASMLNGMLTNTFYSKWSSWHVAGILCLICILLGISAIPRASWPMYLVGFCILAGIFIFTWIQFIRFSLFPLVTVGGSTLFMLFGLIIIIKAAITRDRAFIKNAFSRYVPEKVVNELLINPELLQLGGEERVITVLFSDVANFTTISESMNPKDLVRLLNEYLTEMTDLVLAQGGIIDKYEGDAIMAEYGAPLPMPDHADTAVMTGLMMQQRLRELRLIWSEKGLPEIRCRVGINTGPMIVGNIGSHQVFDYTVIGDAVNLASRLEGANKRYHTYLMISEFTCKYLSDGLFRMRALDVIKVKGKSKAVKVFEVYGETSKPVDSKDELYYKTYNDAFETYLSRDFPSAIEKFKTALSLRPDDPASKDMITRLDGLNPDELPADWDGSIALTAK